MDAQNLLFDWNAQGPRHDYPKRPPELCDETLRDGIQSPSVVDPPIEVKCQMLALMDALGVTISDIGLPGAGPRAVEDVTTLAKYARDNKLRIQINCAARTVVQDIAPIARIRDNVGIPIVAYCFLGTSPIRQYVEDWNVEKLMQNADEAIRFAVEENLEVAFVTEDTIRSRPETLERLFRHVISLGCRRLVLCDTVGHATPEGVCNLVKFVSTLAQSTDEDVQLDWHGHNDRGLGVVNAMAAWRAGCHRVHGTCLGVGERVGNASIDQLMVNFKLMGVYDHNLTRLTEYVELVRDACKVPLPYNYPVFGTDAFRTATGVHAAAIIKAGKKGDANLVNTVYSGVPAEWFGRPQIIDVGPMSGLSNVRYFFESRGISVGDDVIQAVMAHAKKCDRILTEDEILGFCRR